MYIVHCARWFRSNIILSFLSIQIYAVALMDVYDQSFGKQIVYVLTGHLDAKTSDSHNKTKMYVIIYACICIHINE